MEYKRMQLLVVDRASENDLASASAAARMQVLPTHTPQPGTPHPSLGCFSAAQHPSLDAGAASSTPHLSLDAGAAAHHHSRCISMQGVQWDKIKAILGFIIPDFSLKKQHRRSHASNAQLFNLKLRLRHIVLQLQENDALRGTREISCCYFCNCAHH